MSSDSKKLLEQFMDLFRGSTRSFGQWSPNGMITEKAHYQTRHYIAHLRGERGLGLVPILDDNTCWFAVIDIDCHGDDDPEIDVVALAVLVEQFKLPLVVCRSKSGGAHIYLFLRTPAPATLCVQALNRWAAQLGYPGVEIFPKQTKLLMDGGELQLGNWINLPYFKARDTVRYAVDASGKQLDIAEFIELAYARRTDAEALAQYSDSDHNEAPPCVQRMMTEGVQDGYRNEALYAATVYFRKAFDADWRERALAFNDSVLANPLPAIEAKRTIKSAGRRDYSYKCGSEPCKSLCNRSVCLTREHGITPSNIVGDAGSPPMPEVLAVRRYDSEPPRYELTADNVVVSCSSDTFQTWRLLKKKLQDALQRILPNMKEDRYEKEFLSRYMTMIENVVVPEDASPAGLARARCCEWLKKAKVAEKPEERQAVLRKQPVRCVLNDEDVYIFRSQDLVDHLRRIRSEEVKGSELFHALLPLGLTVKNVRVGKSPVKLWVLPASLAEDEALDPKEFTTEF